RMDGGALQFCKIPTRNQQFTIRKNVGDHTMKRILWIRNCRVKALNVAIAVAVAWSASIASAASTSGPGQSGGSGWPREHVQDGNRLIVYHPQVDDWKNFQDLSWRMAISMTPKGGKPVVGVVEMKGITSIDNVAKLVNISNPQITGTDFPSLD